MPNFTSLSGLFLISLVACLAPFLVYISRLYTLPSVVLEIVGGIIIGPQVLHWVHLDSLQQFFSQLGLCFLLFLAGMEIDLESMRDQEMKRTGSGFLLSLVLAFIVSISLYAVGQNASPLLMTIILASTSLGVVMPILNDLHVSSTAFGKLVIAGATLGEFAPLVLLSLFFSSTSHNPVTQAFLLSCFLLFVLLFCLVVFRLRQRGRFTDALLRLQDTSAQLGVRIAIVLLIGFVFLANVLGSESILGAFVAGVILRFFSSAGETKDMSPTFRIKLNAVGFGFLIPLFYVITGLNFDLQAFANISLILLMLVFLAALLLVRGVPALVYRRHLDTRHMCAVGFLQATSLPFIVAATQIGVQRHLLSTAISAALIGAGLLSVIIYPFIALMLLRGAGQSRDEGQLTSVSQEPV